MAASTSCADARQSRAGRRLIAAAMVIALAAGLWDMARDRLDRWIAATPLPPLVIATGTEVLARDGSLLRAFQVDNGLWRLAPPEAGIDPLFLKMLIAWEDRRFAEHPGVDLRAGLRAALQAVRSGRIVSGASTLSMQTARLLERGRAGDWRAKLRQARLALALERRLGKDGVLQLYLRLAPYGGNTEGVRAAALSWFGKEPTRLTPAESALLVALPQSPEWRRPDRPEARLRALAARDRVISRAEAEGLIDAEAAAAARATPLPIARRDFPQRAALMAERLRRAYPAGARIHTTIDPALQRAAEEVVRRATASQSQRVSAAAMLADHQTGEVLAEVGTASFAATGSAGFVDMTRALRSPGSTLKPFVYALGFDEGLIHPDTLIEDRPTVFGRWQPENFDHRFRGTVTVRQALQESLNIPVVRVAEQLGPARVMAGLRAAGLNPQSRAAPGLAVVLGGTGVSLRDLVAGYGMLARGGMTVSLHELADAPEAVPVRALSPQAAWRVGQILARVRPPAGRAAGRIAFKTGTSYGHRDAISVGYDGRFVAGVWLGRADGTPVPGAFGGELAAPALFDLFDLVASRSAPLPPPPEGLLARPVNDLPPGLRRLSRPGEATATVTAEGAADTLTVVFPPDGAEIEMTGGTIPLRLRGGTAPFTWLRNGAPVILSTLDASAEIEVGRGTTHLSLIDGNGTTRRVTIRVRMPGS